MFEQAGIFDRLLEICRFARSSLFEAVGMELRHQVELALSLDEQQLADLYSQLCQQDEAEFDLSEPLIQSCELALAACHVIRSVIWDIGPLSSYREAEGALQEARTAYLQTRVSLRESMQDVQVFA